MSNHIKSAEFVQDLLDGLELIEIRPVEVLGTSRGEETADANGAVEFTFKVSQPEELDSVSVEVVAEARSGKTILRCSYIFRYNLGKQISLDNDAVREDFLNKIVIFHATPYIREGLDSLAARLHVSAPLLPLLKVTDIENDDRVNGAQSDNTSSE